MNIMVGEIDGAMDRIEGMANLVFYDFNLRGKNK
jgi:hypothetical protein